MPLIIDIKVTPSAGRQAWALDKNGGIKCYLKSPPEKGLANKELIKTIAKAVGVSQDKVEILTGETSRTKRIKIAAEMTRQAFLACFGIDEQQPLF